VLLRTEGHTRLIDPLKLREIRQKSSIPAWELMRRLDAQNLNYIFRVERGEREPTYKTIRRFAQALGVPIWQLVRDDVLRELAPASAPAVAEDSSGYRVGPGIIPVVGYASAGDASAPEYTNGDTPAGVGVLGDIDPAQDFGPGAYAIRVKGDSMLPRFRNGNLLIVSPEARWGDGDTCLVRHVDGHVWIKRLSAHGSTWCLESDNPAYPTIPLRQSELAYVHRVTAALLR